MLQICSADWEIYHEFQRDRVPPLQYESNLKNISKTCWQKVVDFHKWDLPCDLNTDFNDIVIFCVIDSTTHEFIKDLKEAVHPICVKIVVYSKRWKSVLNGENGANDGFYFESGQSRVSATHGFILISKEFCQKEWAELASKDFFKDELYRNKSRIIPVLTEKRSTMKSSGYDIPMGLKSLKSLNYYNKDNIYKERVRQVIKDKIAIRRQKEIDQFDEQCRWVCRNVISKLSNNTTKDRKYSTPSACERQCSQDTGYSSRGSEPYTNRIDQSDSCTTGRNGEEISFHTMSTFSTYSSELFPNDGNFDNSFRHCDKLGKQSNGFHEPETSNGANFKRRSPVNYPESHHYNGSLQNGHIPVQHNDHMEKMPNSNGQNHNYGRYPDCNNQFGNFNSSSEFCGQGQNSNISPEYNEHLQKLPNHYQKPSTFQNFNVEGQYSKNQQEKNACDQNQRHSPEHHCKDLRYSSSAENTLGQNYSPIPGFNGQGQNSNNCEEHNGHDHNPSRSSETNGHYQKYEKYGEQNGHGQKYNLSPEYSSYSFPQNIDQKMSHKITSSATSTQDTNGHMNRIPHSHREMKKMPRSQTQNHDENVLHSGQFQGMPSSSQWSNNTPLCESESSSQTSYPVPLTLNSDVKLPSHQISTNCKDYDYVESSVPSPQSLSSDVKLPSSIPPYSAELNSPNTASSRGSSSSEITQAIPIEINEIKFPSNSASYHSHCNSNETQNSVNYKRDKILQDRTYSQCTNSDASSNSHEQHERPSALSSNYDNSKMRRLSNESNSSYNSSFTSSRHQYDRQHSQHKNHHQLPTPMPIGQAKWPSNQNPFDLNVRGNLNLSDTQKTTDIYNINFGRIDPRDTIDVSLPDWESSYSSVKPIACVRPMQHDQGGDKDSLVRDDSSDNEEDEFCNDLSLRTLTVDDDTNVKEVV